jgi:hypothetical protein
MVQVQVHAVQKPMVATLTSVADLAVLHSGQDIQTAHVQHTIISLHHQDYLPVTELLSALVQKPITVSQNGPVKDITSLLTH